MPPRYPISWPVATRLLWDTLRLQPRSFRRDASIFVRGIHPPPEVLGAEHIPARGPCLLATNHYARPGFHAWWITLAISALVPVEVHWVITAAWTFPERPYARPLVSLTRWLFPRAAQVYGFSAMPPMPPDPAEAQARAQAVRHTLAYARQAPEPVIGLAPEGRDHPGGALGPLPPGAGRFIAQLAPFCCRIIPIGLYEDSKRLCLSFGPALQLDLPTGLRPSARDHYAGQAVMKAIARQLPAHLRGDYL